MYDKILFDDQAKALTNGELIHSLKQLDPNIYARVYLVGTAPMVSGVTEQEEFIVISRIRAGEHGFLTHELINALEKMDMNKKVVIEFHDIVEDLIEIKASIPYFSKVPYNALVPRAIPSLFYQSLIIDVTHKDIENYKGYLILQYEEESGYRVDFGTKRSKLVETVEEARELVDFRFSPDKWGK